MSPIKKNSLTDGNKGAQNATPAHPPQVPVVAEKTDTPAECSQCPAPTCFHIQDRNDFEAKVERASTPVIVDFFATWCDPCKALTPRLENIIQRMNGKVQLAKVDIDEMTDLAMDYKISSVPVLIRMIDGKEQDRMVGLQNVAKLEAFILSMDENTEIKQNAAPKPKA